MEKWQEKVKEMTGKLESVSSVVEGLIGSALKDKDQIFAKWLQVIEKAVTEISRKAHLGPITIKVHKLPHFKGDLPKYETEGASGMDIRAQVSQNLKIGPGERFLVPTGISVEIPTGYEIQIRPRSGLAIKKGITLLNTPGTIDSDYRGEIMIILANMGQEIFEIHDQDRIAQMVLCPVVKAELVEQELSETDRGEGGFGSTGAH